MLEVTVILTLCTFHSMLRYNIDFATFCTARIRHGRDSCSLCKLSTENWLYNASMATNGSVYNMVSFWFVILLVQPFIEGKHLNLMSIASIFVYFFILQFSQWIESMLLGCFSRCFCILSEKIYVRINTDRPTSLRIKEIIYGDFVEICFIIKLMWNMLIEWQLYA